MRVYNFRKETSERSDEDNWTKKKIIESTKFYVNSIEGCNQNQDNVVTHLFERARVDLENPNSDDIPQEEIYESIIDLEGEGNLRRKINFARSFGLPLSYVLYNDENELVLLFIIVQPGIYRFETQFDSYKEFSDWIASIKGWKSSKSFREYPDLPKFDQKLRRHKTPWPTNIDCFISNGQNNPVGLIEFQNAKKTSVISHCNNDFFLCKMRRKKYSRHGKYYIYHDDIRRWTSQEILRVQSGLRLFVIVWAQDEGSYKFKELEKITIPYFPPKGDSLDWDIFNSYKNVLYHYSNDSYKEKAKEKICDTYSSFNLVKDNGRIREVINGPPLSVEDKTFPSIYYDNKMVVEKDRDSFSEKLIEFMNI